MTQDTSDKSTTEIMTTVREEVAAQDATQQAEFAAIMVRKPSRPRKTEPELNWFLDNARTAKKNSDLSPSADDKFKRKKAGKAKP
jgi:hypothetical protein